MTQNVKFYLSFLMVFMMIGQLSIGMDSESKIEKNNQVELAMSKVENNLLYDNLLTGQKNISYQHSKQESTLVTGILSLFSMYYMLFTIIYSCSNYAIPSGELPIAIIDHLKNLINLTQTCPDRFGTLDISGFLAKTQPFSTILMWGMLWFGRKFYNTLYSDKSCKSWEKRLVVTTIAGGFGVSIFAERKFGYYTFLYQNIVHAVSAMTFFSSLGGLQYLQQKGQHFDTLEEKWFKKISFYATIFSGLCGIAKQVLISVDYHILGEGAYAPQAEWALVFFLSLQFLEGIFHKKGSHRMALTIMNMLVLAVIMFTGIVSIFDVFHLGHEYMTGGEY